MKKQYMHAVCLWLFLPAVICFTSMTSAVDCKEKKRNYHITVLHTNDHHGRFWKNSRKEYGMAARKTLIDSIRAEVELQGGFLLLLDAGDMNTGIPESKMLNAKPDIEGMNLLGYDAMVAGNHEFDNPVEMLLLQKTWMKFPLLSSNIYDKLTKKRVFDPFVFFHFQGLKIAVFGLTTEDTVKQCNPENIRNLEFANTIDISKKLVPQLKTDADIVIALVHLGYYFNGKHGQNAPGSVSLARAVEGIDIIVDAHTHTALEQPDIQNNTIIVQAGEYGKYLGRLDLEYTEGKLIQKAYELIPVNLKKKTMENDRVVEVHVRKKIPEDLETLAVLSTYQEAGADRFNMIIGSSNAEFTGGREIVRSGESSLGNLLCRAAMLKTSADVSVMNSGGIRAGLPSGNITYKDVLKVSPFGNTICTVNLNGEELRAYLEKAVNMERDTGAFAQISGATIFLAENKIMRLMVGGEKMSGSRKYKLVIPSYIAAGGDGYPELSSHKSFVDTGFVDADVLKNYISKNSPLKIEDFIPENDKVRRYQSGKSFY